MTSTEEKKEQSEEIVKKDVKDLGPTVHVSSHPVLSHKVSILRSSSTDSGSFRAVLREITYHLGYEATTSLQTKSVQLTVPVGHDHVECTGSKISDRVALIPILRSGLGMIDSMRELLPQAAVHHIGMYKSHLVPVQYYNRLPNKCEVDVAYVLDPVVATASTVLSLIGILKKWGVPKIHLLSIIGSYDGIQKIISKYPDVQINVCTIDNELTEEGIVLPGLGDAGDRLFGTDLPLDDDDEQLMHPSKRKRSNSEATL